MPWDTRSDDELLGALGDITDYIEVEQEEIYSAAMKRGLLTEQDSSFVLNQIRNRIEGHVYVALRSENLRPLS